MNQLCNLHLVRYFKCDALLLDFRYIWWSQSNIYIYIYLDNILVSPCIVILYMVDLYKPAFQLLLNETCAKRVLEKNLYKSATP
jgi:hypothetical protein